MITKTIELYTYDELTPEAQANARAWYADGLEYPWWGEAKKSLDTFLSEFGARVTKYDISPWCSSYIDTDIDDQYDAEHVDHDNDYMPTGFCFDADLWGTYNEYKAKGFDVAYCVDQAVAQWLHAVKDDMEGQYSEDSVADNIMANDYTFTVDGSSECLP